MIRVSSLVFLILAVALAAVSPVDAFAFEECPDDPVLWLERKYIFGNIGNCPEPVGDAPTVPEFEEMQEAEVPPPAGKEVGKPKRAEAPEAPAVEEKKRQYSVGVGTTVSKRYFVGDEPVQVKYNVYVPFRARLGAVDYREAVKPFDLVSVNVGKRIAIPHSKDIELQRITVTVRLPVEIGYGVHNLPALTIPYEHDEFIDGQKRVRKGAVTAEMVALQKVPLYVDVVQERAVGFIADVIPFVLEIHEDNTVEVLNEYPPREPQKGIVYLSAYEPEKPFVLLGASREDYGSQQYRVVRWSYEVAVHDIGEGPFELAAPHVIWRKRDTHKAPGAEEEVRTTSPDPLSILVRSIARSGDTFRAAKGLHHEPRGERTLLLTVPTLAVWMFSGAGVLWAFVLALQALRARRIRATVPQAEEMPMRPKPLYDRSPIQRKLIINKLQKARQEFQERPSKENCSALRDLLARRAAIRLGRREQISVQEARAMTAQELRDLVGETPEVRDIEELDRQLETGHYTRLTASGGKE